MRCIRIPKAVALTVLVLTASTPFLTPWRPLTTVAVGAVGRTGLCPSAPASTCAEARKSLLLIKDNGQPGASEGDKLLWKWIRGQEVTQAELADPTTTADYQLCVYTGTAVNLTVEMTVPAGPNWSVLSTKGYKYKDTSHAADGTGTLLLKGGSDGRSKMLLKAKDGNIPMPMLPLTTDVVVQLSNADNAGCWQAVFPPDSVKKCNSKKCKMKRTQTLPPQPSKTPTRTITPTRTSTPTVTRTPTRTPTYTFLPTRTAPPAPTATPPPSPTATPTATATGSPSNTWTPNGSPTPCSVKITDENDVEQTGTVSAIVAALDEFKAAVTPAGVCGTCAYQWTIEGADQPAATVAIKTYRHVMANSAPGANGLNGWTHTPQPLVPSDLRTKDVNFFWTREQGPKLKVTVSTASGTTCSAEITMDVKHAKDGANVDPNRVIYSSATPSVKLNPDGVGGFYESLNSHGLWHLAPNVLANYHCRFSGAACTGAAADCPGVGDFCALDQDYDGGLFTKTMQGNKFFTYHDALVAQHVAWRSTFNVTTPIDPTIGPVVTDAKFCNSGPRVGFQCVTDNTANFGGCPGGTCPGCCLAQTFFTPQGGSTPSPIYGYVRLGEFADTEHLGDEIEPWHALGHGQLGNANSGDMTSQFTALHERNNVFWGWHTRLAQFRNDFLAINHVADRAAVLATIPGNGSVGVANGLTTITVTFDRPVSANAPADNTAQVTKGALTITPPGGGAPLVATAVSTTNYQTHTFTVPALTTAGLYTAKLTGTERGFLGPGNANAFSFSFTVAP